MAGLPQRFCAAKDLREKEEQAVKVWRLPKADARETRLAPTRARRQRRKSRHLNQKPRLRIAGSRFLYGMKRLNRRFGLDTSALCAAGTPQKIREAELFKRSTKCLPKKAGKRWGARGWGRGSKSGLPNVYQGYFSGGEVALFSLVLPEF